MITENSLQINEKDNEELVKESKSVIKKLIVFYAVIAIICLFLFQLKWVAIIVSFLQVGIALYYYNKSKGIITIDYNVKSSEPSLFFPLLIPTIILFATGIIEITVLDYSSFWIPSILFLSIFMLVIIRFISKNETKGKIQPIITSLILCAAFSFGFTINTNEAFCLKADEQYKTIIIDKWVIENKNTTYHFMLLPWGPMKDSSSIKVLQYQYNNHQLGDSITIEYNSGLYNIPFIRLIDK